jgi:hypothetical protein
MRFHRANEAHHATADALLALIVLTTTARGEDAISLARRVAEAEYGGYYQAVATEFMPDTD